jgi:hypothetical protein
MRLPMPFICRQGSVGNCASHSSGICRAASEIVWMAHAATRRTIGSLQKVCSVIRAAIWNSDLHKAILKWQPSDSYMTGTASRSILSRRYDSWDRILPQAAPRRDPGVCAVRGHSARDGCGETIAGASHPVLRVTMPLPLRRDPAETPLRRLERRAPGEGRYGSEKVRSCARADF